MSKEGIMRSSDLWRENGMRECTQSFSICSEVDPLAFNMSVTDEVRNAFTEEIAAQFRTFLRQPGRLNATNSIMDVGQGHRVVQNDCQNMQGHRVVQNDCQNTDNPGPSGTHGNFHQDISIPNAHIRNSQIHVEIVEEPLSDGIKFRYEKEGRLSSCIIGVNSTKTLKTFPTIKIHGYQGAAYVVVSLVSLEPPYYPHPHKLAGKLCKNGVCVKQIDNPEMICSFFNLRIQCVKRKDVKASLAEREAFQVDPFRTGFSHSNEPRKINYNAIRLCFHVFLPDSNGQFCRPLDPVLSTPIGNSAVNQLYGCNVPVNQLDPPASAPVLRNISNYEYASSYYSKQPVSSAGAEFIAIQPNVYQNIDVNPFDQQMESLSGNLSDLILDLVKEHIGINSVGLMDGKIVEEQNPFQVNTRTKDGAAEISADNTFQTDFNSNESHANLSGMTIDSFTETVGLISVGLIDEKNF